MNQSVDHVHMDVALTPRVKSSFTGCVMSTGVRIRDFESSRRRFERISWTFVQASLAFFLALLFTTVIPAIGFVSFIKLVAELMSN